MGQMHNPIPSSGFENQMHPALALVATTTSAETAAKESPRISLGYPNPSHAFMEDLSNMGQ